MMWTRTQPIRFGETTPLGLCGRRSCPDRLVARNESFVTRLGCLVAVVDRGAIADCFWSTACPYTAYRGRWPVGATWRYKELRTAGGVVAPCGTQPMVSLSYLPSQRITLADAWRAAVHCPSDGAATASWRTDIAALFDWIDNDPRGMPVLLANASGLVLLDGPTTVVAEIVWSHGRLRRDALFYVDLVDLCRALEYRPRERARYEKNVAGLVSCAPLQSLLLLLSFFSMVCAVAVVSCASARGLP
ncbi:hypothetical protein pkur_cds_83 [Pandoravirus kuranda]|uniref:Uncharacterized protein n=1 Tax=Pandoravirus kuranda TaxID=3019033 RepID=A0AA95EE20_9VIRU|nr:hypothetical protein pkur_cds_83 [Pandoravirus kuranda]